MTEDSRLECAIYCLCECMGMQAENMNRAHRGEAMAYDESDFARSRIKWGG